MLPGADFRSFSIANAGLLDSQLPITRIESMARLVGLSIIAIRFTALAITRHQTPSCKSPKSVSCRFGHIPLSFEFGERCGHVASFYLTAFNTVR
jgi:hypothetical protein